MNHLSIQIQQVLRVIDGPDKYPAAGVEHSMLIGRKVHMTLDQLSIRIRKVPKPLVDIKEMELHGTLIFTEPRPAANAMINVPVSNSRGRRACRSIAKHERRMKCTGRSHTGFVDMALNYSLYSAGLFDHSQHSVAAQRHDTHQGVPCLVHEGAT